MNRRFGALLCCIALVTFTQGENFNFDGSTIEVPAPENYVRVTDKMDAVHRLFLQMGENASSSFMAYYIPESEAGVAQAGYLPPLPKSYILGSQRFADNAFVTTEEFVVIKEDIKKANKEIFESLKPEIADDMKKLSEGINGEFDVELALKVSGMVPLDPHYESKTTFSYSVYSTVLMESGGFKVAQVQVVTITLLHIDGKIAILYCIAPKDDLEWTRKSSKNWAEKIVGVSTPTPPTMERSESADRGRTLGVLLALGVLLVGVLSMAYLFPAPDEHESETNSFKNITRKQEGLSDGNHQEAPTHLPRKKMGILDETGGAFFNPPSVLHEQKAGDMRNDMEGLSPELTTTEMELPRTSTMEVIRDDSVALRAKARKPTAERDGATRHNTEPRSQKAVAENPQFTVNKGLTSEEFSRKISFLGAVNTAYKIENRQIENCGLATFDFDGTTETLFSIIGSATLIRNTLLKHSSQREGHESIQIAIAYSNKLIECTTSRHDISAKLAQQAKGISYGFCAYRNDLKAFQRLEKDRQALEIILQYEVLEMDSGW